MAETGRKVEVRFGTFSCSIEGYDNPVEQMREVLLLMQQMVRETPMLADYGPEIGDDEVAQIESALGHRSAGADGESPGIVVIRAGGAEARSHPEDAVTTAEIPPRRSAVRDGDAAWAPDSAGQVAAGVAPVMADRADDASGWPERERHLGDETEAEPAAGIDSGFEDEVEFEFVETDWKAEHAPTGASAESAELERVEPEAGEIPRSGVFAFGRSDVEWTASDRARVAEAAADDAAPGERSDAGPGAHGGSDAADNAGPAPEVAHEGAMEDGSDSDRLALDAEDLSPDDAADDFRVSTLDQGDPTAFGGVEAGLGEADGADGTAHGHPFREAADQPADQPAVAAFDPGGESAEPREASNDGRGRPGDGQAAAEAAFAASDQPAEVSGEDWGRDADSWTDESDRAHAPYHDWRRDGFGVPGPGEPRHVAADTGTGEPAGETGRPDRDAETDSERPTELEARESLADERTGDASALFDAGPEAPGGEEARDGSVMPPSPGAAAAGPIAVEATEAFAGGRERGNIFAPPAAAGTVTLERRRSWPEAAGEGAWPGLNIFAPPADDGPEVAGAGILALSRPAAPAAMAPRMPSSPSGEQPEDETDARARDDGPLVHAEAVEPAAETDVAREDDMTGGEDRRGISHAPDPEDSDRPATGGVFAAPPGMAHVAGAVMEKERSAAEGSDAPGLGRFTALFARLGGRATSEPRAASAVAGGDPAPGGSGPHAAADLAGRAGAQSVPELMAAAAAWLTLVEDKPRFTRREVMEIFERLPGDHPRTLEARIKGFGQLVRSGTLLLVGDAVFAMAQDDRDRFQAMLDRD